MAEKKLLVREGDTLWSIAERELGSPERWPDLVRDNKEVLAKRAYLPADITLVIKGDFEPGPDPEPSQL